MDGLICWLIHNKCKHAAPPKKCSPIYRRTFEQNTQLDMKNQVRSYIINEDSQLLGDWGYSLTDDPEVCSVSHHPVSLTGGTDTFTDTVAHQIYKEHAQETGRKLNENPLN